MYTHTLLHRSYTEIEGAQQVHRSIGVYPGIHASPTEPHPFQTSGKRQDKKRNLSCEIT